MKSKILVLIGLMLFVLVLIGVTLIQPFGKAFPWMESLAPMIVIAGFFTFLVAVALFLYGLLGILNQR